jgi:hypothetical protein
LSASVGTKSSGCDSKDVSNAVEVIGSGFGVVSLEEEDLDEDDVGGRRTRKASLFGESREFDFIGEYAGEVGGLMKVAAMASESW